MLARGVSMRRPICFVVMPFHAPASEVDGRSTDFDEIFAHLIAPAVEDAGLRPHRADEETLGGIFHKHMFERLALCEFAVADMTMANPNVFYELGVRHAIRPWSTVLMYRSDARLPLDVALDAALPYPADLMTKPDELARLRSQLTRRLKSAQARETDSPVHQLVAGLPIPEVDHRRVDLMLEAIDRESALARTISSAAADGLDSLRRLRTEIGDVGDLDSESAVALMLAFRSVNGWHELLEVVNSMPPELAEVFLVREQQALALGRCGRFREAGTALNELLMRRPNSETYGILGGVQRREWEHALATGESVELTSGLLNRAADTYLAGFETDLRDPYPGVNAVCLLALSGRLDELAEIAPVVRYCVNRRLSGTEVEYWDYVCDLQLAVAMGDHDRAERALPKVLTNLSEPFQATSTADGLAVLAAHCEVEQVRARVTSMAKQIARRGEAL